MVDDFRIERESLSDPDDPKRVVWDVIAPIYWALRTPYEPDPRLDHLSAGQRALYALHWTASEVTNGGLEQYFFNATGVLADAAIQGAKLIDAPELAEVISQAVACLFPRGLVAGHAARRAAVQTMSDDERINLQSLDERFYRLIEQHSHLWLQRKAAHYVCSHPAEFFKEPR